MAAHSIFSLKVKSLRIAQFLKEYWGVKQGKKGQNVPIKTISDVADTIGEEERTTKRLLKLNDLIPELQSLVSAGKLGTTAAGRRARLSKRLNGKSDKAGGRRGRRRYYGRDDPIQR